MARRKKGQKLASIAVMKKGPAFRKKSGSSQIEKPEEEQVEVPADQKSAKKN